MKGHNSLRRDLQRMARRLHPGMEGAEGYDQIVEGAAGLLDAFEAFYRRLLRGEIKGRGHKASVRLGVANRERARKAQQAEAADMDRVAREDARDFAESIPKSRASRLERDAKKGTGVRPRGFNSPKKGEQPRAYRKAALKAPVQPIPGE